jgi:hypothetical protein
LASGEVEEMEKKSRKHRGGNKGIKEELKEKEEIENKE